MEPPPVSQRDLKFFIRMEEGAKKRIPLLSNYERALVKADEKDKRKGKSSSSGPVPDLSHLSKKDAQRVKAMPLDQQANVLKFMEETSSEKRKRKKHVDELIESQRGSIDKFFKSSTTTSKNPDDLMIVVVEEQTNTIPEDNVGINTDDNNVSDHEHFASDEEPVFTSICMIHLPMRRMVAYLDEQQYICPCY
uniref:Uncharacterized protein n=1 Tax=Setaria viridis TaxID=4556 RepID=A0A4U6TM12_SETVI|nr:hypothetical protein SEVIR_7G052600v2 [Setaria viridis]